MYYTLCSAYTDIDGLTKGKDPIEERSKLSALFSGSCSPKLSFSITTNKLAHSELIAGENDSLRRQEPENETRKCGCFCYVAPGYIG